MKRIPTHLAALLLLAMAARAADADPGRNLAATCAACHGTDGRSAGVNASLAGAEKAKLVETLKAFKTGEKPATVMNQLAKGYSDAQIDAIAGYFSALPK